MSAHREIPASPLLLMLLDRIMAEAGREIQTAATNEAKLRGIDLSTSYFDADRRVWIVPAPAAPDGA